MGNREHAAWQTVLSYLPPRLQTALMRLPLPPGDWTELRLRGRGCVSVTGRCFPASGGGFPQNGNYPLPGVTLSGDELREILSRICEGSVHAYDTELRRGYLSAGGGIRVGICGRALCGTDGKEVERLRTVTSLCIRLPHRISFDGDKAVHILYDGSGTDAETGKGESGEHAATEESRNGAPNICSTLFYAPPGCGKTTLLRSLIASLTKPERGGLRGAVIDTGEELWDGYTDGMTDVFSAYPRDVGISLAVRAFSPQVIFCDELGTEEEAEAVLRAQAGGVPLLATAHADTLEGLLSRPCFAKLDSSRVFSRYVRVTPENGGFSFRREDVRGEGDTS